MKRIKTFFKQLFCKHDFEWCKSGNKFFSLNGERHYLVCRKCGKIERSVFVKYD